MLETGRGYFRYKLYFACPSYRSSPCINRRKRITFGYLLANNFLFFVVVMRSSREF